MLPMVAVVMIILIVGAVFSVDIAHMHMVRAELRTATDAAARAGAEAIARTQDPNAAIDAALNVAQQNIVSADDGFVVLLLLTVPWWWVSSC